MPVVSRRWSALLLGLLASAWIPTTVGAQVARFEGASIERFRGEYRLNVVNYRRTDLTPAGYGSDVAIGFAPDYLGVRTLLLDLDLGFAYAVPVGPARLLLKGGAAAFFAIGEVHDVYPGLQAGVGTALPLQRRCYLRLDLSRRIYLVPGETLRLWSVGVGLSAGLPH
jgi:hypothetical protein